METKYAMLHRKWEIKAFAFLVSGVELVMQLREKRETLRTRV